MCVNCWNEAGQPANWTPEIAEALALVRELYAIHPTGGPLHVQLDDWNIDGDIVPIYKGWLPRQLEARYLDGWPVDDEAQVPGRSLRQLCDEIAAKMGPMTLEDRMSVLAYHDGFTVPPIAEEAQL